MVPPATVVKFRDAGSRVDVSGIMQAVGSPAAPIVFTSLVDDAYGSDTNGDGQATAPTPASWDGLRVLTGGQLTLDHAVVQYAGAGGLGAPSSVYRQSG